MHGQKKRRKRSLDGLIQVDGHDLAWTLLSEPQWTTEGPMGLRVRVQAADAPRRELIIEFPFDPAAFVPQRPTLTPAIVTAAIQDALQNDWDPTSRGRPHHHRSTIPLGTGKQSSANAGIQKYRVLGGGG